MGVSGEFRVRSGLCDARLVEIELDIAKCQMAGVDRRVVFPAASGDRKREFVEALEVPWNGRVEYPRHDQHPDDTHSREGLKCGVKVRLGRTLCKPARRNAVSVD